MRNLKIHDSIAEIEITPGTTYAVFMTEEHIPDFPLLQKAMSESEFYGAVVPYLISDKQMISNGVAVMELAADTGFAFTCDTTADAMEIASLMSDTEAVTSLLLFVDGLSPHLDQFINALGTCSDNLAVLGTGVGCKDFVQRPVVFDCHGLKQDRALVIGTDLRLQIAAKHGWKTIHGPLVVTKAHDNILFELNSRPAFEVYREVLQNLEKVTITPEGFFDVAKSYPFGVSNFQGGEIIVRDPLMANPDGSLTIVSSVKEMDTLYIMKGCKDELLASSSELSRETFAHSTGKQAILFNCISRVLFLEDDFNREIEGLYLNSGIPDLRVFGVTSIGEITNIGYEEIKILNKSTLLGVVENA